jgi:hypothetical protein
LFQYFSARLSHFPPIVDLVAKLNGDARFGLSGPYDLVLAMPFLQLLSWQLFIAMIKP